MKTARQLINIYRKIPRTTKTRGALWYQIASDFACSLSRKYGIDYFKVCGVISALSPANNWENNKAEAEAICFAYANDCEYSIKTFRTYLSNVGKAIQIIESNGDEEKIASILYGVAGYKTHAFFYNIAYASSDTYVTVDRHILTIMDEDKIKSRKHYYELSEVLKQAAKKLKLLPQDLQAILWVNHLETR